jgi:phosphate:Na+ symporter
MQSSSAAIAIILTAVSGGIVPLTDAAAVVIGANVGTTSTAALAVIGATPNAKRLAGGHVLFNLFTALVAFLILPFLLLALQSLQAALSLEDSPVTLLALFHTTFNVLGVLILFPFSRKMVAFLEKRFRTIEEDESRPQFLDRNVLATPVIALHAMAMELRRIGEIARRMAKGSISTDKVPGKRLSVDKVVIDELNKALGTFGKELQRENLSKEMRNQLPTTLRVAGYYRDVAEIAMDVARLQADPNYDIAYPEIVEKLAGFKSNTVKLLRIVDSDLEDYSAEACKQELEKIKDEYRDLKNDLLQAATREDVSVRRAVHCLDIIARIRRMAEQAEKGARYLAYLTEVEEQLMHEEENEREGATDLLGR